MNARRKPKLGPLWAWRVVSAALFFALLGSGNVHGQSRLRQFCALSGPVQRWTLGHLRVAGQVQRLSARAVVLTDSLRAAGTLGQDANGGRLDAFRHGIWMALLAQGIGPGRAERLGQAYERGNHRTFRRRGTEDGSLQDAAASRMDLHNNHAGAALGLAGKAEAELVADVIAGIAGGDFACIAKDAQGRSLDADGNALETAAWLGKWENARHLVSSDMAAH